MCVSLGPEKREKVPGTGNFERERRENLFCSEDKKELKDPLSEGSGGKGGGD